MRNWKNKLIDIIFLSVLGILLLVLIIPWPFPKIEVKYSQEPFTKRIDLSEEKAYTAELSVAQCASLFGVRPPRSKSPNMSTSTKPTDTGPQTVPWLKYIGMIATPEGIQKHYFKDTRRSRIIRLAVGETAGGWTLSAMSAQQFTLKNEGKSYIVPK